MTPRDALGLGLRPRPTGPARDADVEGLLPPPAGPAVRPAGPGAPRPGPRLVAAGARREPAADPGRGRVRPRDRRLRAVRARTSAAAYRMLGLPDHVDVEAVARHELRWWVVRREIGLAAGAAAGEAITDLYAALYDVPRERVAEAGRLRGHRRRGPRPRRDRRPGRPARCRARPTGRRSRGCCASRIGASAPGSQPRSRCRAPARPTPAARSRPT